jgi:uncharacterized membrane protein
MSPFASRIVGFALVAAAVSPPPAGAASIYDMTNLTDVIFNTIGAGGVGDHTRFVATGINDLGTIIGTASSGPLDRSVVALISPGLTSTTTFTASNDGLGRPIQLEGYKVNNNNDFVGDAYVFTSPTTQSPTESLIWAGGVGHVLNVAPGVDNRALGINDAANVVGNVQAVTYASKPPFTLDPTVTMQIPELTGGNYLVEDINNSGVIVGTKDANFFHGGTGFIDDHGTVTTFSFPGAAYTYANGISNNGLIVGSWFDAQGLSHGYVDNNGVFTDVELPNNVAGYFEGINDAGQIVGEFAYDAGLTQDGFLLNPVNDIISDVARLSLDGFVPGPAAPGPINPFLLAAGLPLKEFRQTAVPEPPTWAMLTLGLAGLGCAAFARGRKRPAATA